MRRVKIVTGVVLIALIAEGPVWATGDYSQNSRENAPLPGYVRQQKQKRDALVQGKVDQLNVLISGAAFRKNRRFADENTEEAAKVIPAARAPVLPTPQTDAAVPLAPQDYSSETVNANLPNLDPADWQERSDALPVTFMSGESAAWVTGIEDDLLHTFRRPRLTYGYLDIISGPIDIYYLEIQTSENALPDDPFAFVNNVQQLIAGAGFIEFTHAKRAFIFLAAKGTPIRYVPNGGWFPMPIPRSDDSYTPSSDEISFTAIIHKHRVQPLSQLPGYFAGSAQDVTWYSGHAGADQSVHLDEQYVVTENQNRVDEFRPVATTPLPDGALGSGPSSQRNSSEASRFVSPQASVNVPIDRPKIAPALLRNVFAGFLSPNFNRSNNPHRPDSTLGSGLAAIGTSPLQKIGFVLESFLIALRTIRSDENDGDVRLSSKMAAFLTAVESILKALGLNMNLMHLILEFVERLQQAQVQKFLVAIMPYYEKLAQMLRPIAEALGLEFPEQPQNESPQRVTQAERSWMGQIDRILAEVKRRFETDKTLSPEIKETIAKLFLQQTVLYDNTVAPMIEDFRQKLREVPLAHLLEFLQGIRFDQMVTLRQDKSSLEAVVNLAPAR